MNRFNKLAQNFLQKTSLNAPVVCFDLGSSHTRMIVDGKLVFFDKTCYVKKKATDYVLALGSAEVQIDKTENSQLELVHPIRYGKITSTQELSVFLYALLQKYIKKAGFLSIVKPTIYCSLPSEFSKVQKKALYKSFKQAGSGSIIFIQSSEAIYKLIHDSYKNLSKIFAIDIGAETTSISFLSPGESSLERKIEWGANLFTDSIIDYVRNNYKVLLCRDSAEKIKHEIALLPTKRHEKDQPLELTVRAKDLISNLPTTITVQSDDFKQLFSQLMLELIEAFELVFDQLNPSQLELISEHGLFLVGGGSQLRFMADYLLEKLRIPVTIVHHPSTVVIRGVELVRKHYEIS